MQRICVVPNWASSPVHVWTKLEMWLLGAAWSLLCRDRLFLSNEVGYRDSCGCPDPAPGCTFGVFKHPGQGCMHENEPCPIAVSLSITYFCQVWKFCIWSLIVYLSRMISVLYWWGGGPIVFFCEHKPSKQSGHCHGNPLSFQKSTPILMLVEEQ